MAGGQGGIELEVLLKVLLEFVGGKGRLDIIVTFCVESVNLFSESYYVYLHIINFVTKEFFFNICPCLAFALKVRASIPQT